MKRDETTEISPAREEHPDLAALKEQRELALACFILSASLSVAVLLSNLGAEPKAMGETREAIELHLKLLAQHKSLLADNQKVLAEVEAARDALVRARTGQ